MSAEALPALDQHVRRLKSGAKNLPEAHQNFGKLLKVAGLDAEELNSLLSADHEKRQQLANRAGAVVAKKLLD